MYYILYVKSGFKKNKKQNVVLSALYETKRTIYGQEKKHEIKNAYNPSKCS